MNNLLNCRKLYLYWLLIQQQPIHPDLSNRFRELFEINRFNYVAVDIQIIAFQDVFVF